MAARERGDDPVRFVPDAVHGVLGEVARASRVAVIAFVVNVPVLSLQITDVHPNVSTLGNVLTIAFCFAIFLVPSARHVVTTAGSPSGIAATASATAILK